MVFGRTTRLDVALAAAILVVAELEIAVQDIAHAPVARTTALVACVALAFRRSAPVVVSIICVAAQGINVWAQVPISDLLAPVAWISIAVYTMARHSDLKRALIGEAVVIGMYCTTLFRPDSDWFWAALVLGIPWLVGYALRTSAAETEALSEQVVDLERRREAEVARALDDERKRIARDLHDVIAHSVTVMLVQAGAAQEVLRHDPDQAAQSLDSIQIAGRQALAEMGTLVGMLREDTDELGLAPQPGLAQLHALVDQSSGRGLDITLTIDGTPVPVSPGIQISAYRVVQESLTNVRKHSTAHHADVHVTYTPHCLALRIRNDGESTGDGDGSQRGIVGMHERVSIYDGELTAGPVDGGYEVIASIPLEGAT